MPYYVLQHNQVVGIQSITYKSINLNYDNKHVHRKLKPVRFKTHYYTHNEIYPIKRPLSRSGHYNNVPQ